MKPAPFTLVRARTVDECLAALAAPDTTMVKVIAGGQSLMPLLALRMSMPDTLVDVSLLGELKAIVQGTNFVELGARVRHCELLEKPVAQLFPALAMAAGHIGHIAIRNRGTLGGSLCHADPAAELPAIMVLHDAEMICSSQAAGVRVVPASEFFLGPYTTALRDDELLLRVRLPKPVPNTTYGFVEFSPRHGDYARAGAACSVGIGPDRRIAHVRAVLFAVGSSPVDISADLAPAAGQNPGAPEWSELIERVMAGLPTASDRETASRYRLAKVALRRALRQARPTQVPHWIDEAQ